MDFSRYINSVSFWLGTVRENMTLGTGAKGTWRHKRLKHGKTHQRRQLISSKERELFVGYEQVICILEDPIINF